MKKELKKHMILYKYYFNIFKKGDLFMKKVIRSIVCLLLVAALLTSYICAAETRSIPNDAKSITFGTPVTDKVTSSDQKSYRLTLSKSGKVEVTGQISANCTLSLLDAGGNAILTKNFLKGVSSSDPSLAAYALQLTQGTYYVSFAPYSGVPSIDYTLTFSFESANDPSRKVKATITTACLSFGLY